MSKILTSSGKELTRAVVRGKYDALRIFNRLFFKVQNNELLLDWPERNDIEWLLRRTTGAEMYTLEVREGELMWLVNNLLKYEMSVIFLHASSVDRWKWLHNSI